MSISHAEAANFSNFAYHFNDVGWALPQSYVDAGWRVLDKTQSNQYNTGYDGIALVKEVNGVPTDLVIATRGTQIAENFSWHDANQLLNVAMGFNDMQVLSGENFLSQVQSTFVNRYSSSNIDPLGILTLTGHSQGGLVATVMASHLGEFGNAIVFDPPKSNFSDANGAHIDTILAGPNFFNTAGGHTQLGNLFGILDSSTGHNFVSDPYLNAVYDYLYHTYGMHDIDRIVSQVELGNEHLLSNGDGYNINQLAGFVQYLKSNYVPPYSDSNDNNWTTPFLPNVDDPNSPNTPLTPSQIAQLTADGYGYGMTLASPLVLDLGNDGFDIKGMNEVSVFFNTDGGSLLQRVGWVGPQEGLLAIDTNGNGKIDTINELFGNATTSGFTVLSQLDSNGDGVINASDAQFANLRIWQDLNQNGRTDAGELTSLADNGITAINLNAANVDQWVKGNHITQTSSYTQNGVAHQIEDVWFQTDHFNSIDDTSVAIDPVTMLLPHSRGYGTLHSLAVAMTGDATLMTMVENLALSSAANAGTWDSQVKAIMYEWAGVTSQTTARGAYLTDVRDLEFLEHMMAQNAQATPGYTQAVQYEKVFAGFQEEMMGRLLAVSALRSIFSEAQYDYATDTLKMGTLGTILSNISASTVTHNDAYWTHVLKILGSHFDQFGTATQDSVTLLQGLAQTHLDQPQTLTFSLHNGAITYDYYSGTVLQGTTAADTMTGADGNDVINGLSGDDYLNGGAGNDLLIGGAGNDSLVGSSGNNTFLFAANEGSDTIGTSSSSAFHDIIRFTDATTSANLTFNHVGNDLVINNTLGGSITVQELFAGAGSGFYQDATEIRFADGTTIDLTQGLPFTGTASADVMHGTDHNDILYGLAGNDSLWGENGNDTLAGGSGSDYLTGGAGSDTFVITKVDSTKIDTIADFSGSAGDVIDITDMHVSEFTKLLISNQSGMAEVLFNNGQKLDLTGVSASSLTASNFTGFTHIADVSQTLTGSTGNDSMYGGDADDVLYGMAGNDTLSGGGGNNTLIGGTGNDSLVGGVSGDVYQLQIGDGTDVIADTYGVNHIKFIDSTNTQTISIDRSSNDMVIHYGTSDQVTIQNMYTSGGANQGYVSDIQFNDGSTLGLNNLFVSTGTSSANNINGTSNNDYMYGLAGNDTLSGLDGNDTLVGGAGDDSLSGGLGNDTYRFIAGEGNDTIAADANGVNVMAFTDSTTFNNLSFTHTSQDVTITNSLGGSIKLLNAFSSSDTTALTGYISLIKFADGTSFDMSQGLPLNGTASAETLRGSTGNDIIYGLGGNDTIQGYAGNNTLIGGTGDDSITAGSGNDTYRFAAGDGNDTIAADTGGTNVIAFTDSTTAANVTMSRSVQDLVITNSLGGSIKVVGAFGASGSVYSNEISTIQFADGTSLDLTHGLPITGTSGADNLRGSDSADVLNGLAGNDTLTGYEGNNILIGGTGNDSMSAGTGNDTYRFIAGDGADTISADTGGTNVISYTDSTKISDVTISRSVQDLIITNSLGGSVKVIGAFGASGNVYNNEISTLQFADGTSVDLTHGLPVTGTSGADNMRGSDGNDIMYGLDGSDTMQGYAGDDIFYGGLGSDTITAGTGKDTLVMTPSTSVDTDVINDFTISENDVIDVSALSIVGFSNLTITNVSGSAQIAFPDGQKVKLIGVSSSSVNASYFTGFTGPNLTLTGGSGDDSLAGGAAHDSISGLGGNDTLIGGAGNDTLIGGAGNDSLVGGTGSDVFAFATGYGHDTISDFVHGTDKLQFTASGLGIATPADVMSHATVSGSDTVITFSSDIITLTGVTNLSSSDILIV